MALDESTRRQLKEARANIIAELQQLELRDGDGNPYTKPNCRQVYADLQRELHEIDALLGTSEHPDDQSQSDYEPMVRWYADGTVRNPVRPTMPGRIIGVISLALLVLSLGFAILRTLAE